MRSLSPNSRMEDTRNESAKRDCRNVLAVLEGGLGDAGFAEFAEAFGDHACRIVPLWRVPAADRDSDCVRVRGERRCLWLGARC